MTVRIAIASFAHVHAESYIQLLREWPGVELLSCDEGAPELPGEIRGAEFARALQVPYVDTYEELFAWKPDGVIVCSENSRHRVLTEQAAAAGAQILCEKPLATTVEDGRAMIAACEEAGVFLMMAYPVHFAPQYRALAELVNSGAAGTVLVATGTNNGRIPVGTRSWFTDVELAGGGALVDHVVHVAELLDDLLGGEPASSVHAYTNRILHGDNPLVGAETGGIVTIRYRGGVQASIDCSWSQPLDAPVWGGLTLEVLTDRGKVAIAPFADRVSGFSQQQKNALWVSFGDNLDRLMLETFIEGITGGEAPQPDGMAGLRTLEIVVAAQRSASSGQVVNL